MDHVPWVPVSRLQGWIHPDGPLQAALQQPVPHEEERRGGDRVDWGRRQERSLGRETSDRNIYTNHLCSNAR